MRGFLRRGAEREFNVELTVHRLNSIPVTHRNLFIHWRMARRDAGSPHYGFTAARPVEPGNFVEWGTTFPFVARIGADPADSDALTLQSTMLQLQLRSERRSRIGLPSYNPEGVVEIDLADVAQLGLLDRNFLVQESLLNATLRVTVKMTHLSGDKVFRTRAIAPPGLSDPALSMDALAAVVQALPPARALRRNESAARLAGCADARASAASLGDRTRSGSAGVTRNGSFIRIPSAGSVFPGGDISPGKEPTDEREGQTLENYAPDANLVQAEVYEQIFWQRLRDHWPDKVTSSRWDAVECMEKLFAQVFHNGKAQVPTQESRQASSVGSESAGKTKMDETKMTVEGLLASLYQAPSPRPTARWRFGEGGEDNAKESTEKKGDV